MTATVNIPVDDFMAYLAQRLDCIVAFGGFVRGTGAGAPTLKRAVWCLALGARSGSIWGLLLGGAARGLVDRVAVDDEKKRLPYFLHPRSCRLWKISPRGGQGFRSIGLSFVLAPSLIGRSIGRSRQLEALPIYRLPTLPLLFTHHSHG